MPCHSERSSSIQAHFFFNYCFNNKIFWGFLQNQYGAIIKMHVLVFIFFESQKRATSALPYPRYMLRLGKNSIWGENSVNLSIIKDILSRFCIPDRMPFYNFEAFLPSLFIYNLKTVFWADLVSLICNFKSMVWAVWHQLPSLLFDFCWV